MGNSFRYLVLSLLVVVGSSIISGNSSSHSIWLGKGATRTLELWPSNVEIARPPATGPEEIVHEPTRVAGRPWTSIINVTRPTLAVYTPRGLNTGTSIIVFPGGGYRSLAIDIEGTEICDWFTRHGVTCAVLKYRVPNSGPYWDDSCNCHKEPEAPMALQDAQRAVRLLRARAASLGISSDRIGVIGFSAGGHLVVDVSNNTAMAYPPVDQVDRLSSRPDYAVALYPGHLWDGGELRLVSSIKVSAKAPPTFLLQAQDDPVDDVRNSLVYFEALTRAHVPVEYHVYAQGGHAFGLRSRPLPITGWPSLVDRWMHTIGMMPSRLSQAKPTATNRK